MNITKQIFGINILLFATVLFISCGNNDEKSPAGNTKDSSKIGRKKEEKKAGDTKTQRPPIVNIVDTLQPRMLVAYCKDSAANFDRIALKLGNIYGVKLAEYLKKNNLKMAGAPMAWYIKQKAPYFFEAGVPITKAGEFIKDNKKIAAGPSYEIYISDPFDKNGKPVDPYKVQTDIVFPIK
jgi:hypothetical protein